VGSFFAFPSQTFSLRRPLLFPPSFLYFFRPIAVPDFQQPMFMAWIESTPGRFQPFPPHFSKLLPFVLPAGLPSPPPTLSGETALYSHFNPCRSNSFFLPNCDLKKSGLLVFFPFHAELGWPRRRFVSHTLDFVGNTPLPPLCKTNRVTCPPLPPGPPLSPLT